jgi:hypothetical protein
MRSAGGTVGVVPHDEDLRQLGALLEAARGITHELVDDPLFARLLDVFQRMPAGDREVVIGALESEVRTRVVSQDVADDLTQIELRPNPHAKIYLRVVERAEENPIDMLAFLRAANSIQRGVDALDPRWKGMVLMALRQIDPAGRASVKRFNDTITELVAEAERLGPVGHPEPPPATEDEPPPAQDTSKRRP